MIERQIVTGLITSTEYFKKVRDIFDINLLESNLAKTLSRWCIDYFDVYRQAPGLEIEALFYKKVAEGLDKETAEEIEEDILPDLSEDYENTDFNLEFLLNETFTYFQSRKLARLSEEIEVLISQKKGSLEDRVKQAEQIARAYKPIQTKEDNTIDLGTAKGREAMEKAFDSISEPIVHWPKQLGKFWNDQFYPGAFIAFLAPEKRGKTFILIEIAMRALKQGKKIAFFQAGDMNENQFLKRIAVYLTRKNYSEKYCTAHYEPVRDCIKNQMDTCNKQERESPYGIWDDLEEDEIRKKSMSELIEMSNSATDYRPCYNCKDFDNEKLGIAFLKYNEAVELLTKEEAVKATRQFLKKYKGQIKIKTYPNRTLTFDMLEADLDYWQETEGFVPDGILSDYIDIMASTLKSELRHQENDKWMRGRQLSQKERTGIIPFFATVTQADAKSYKLNTIGLDNFSEDKRKYGHVTAMYGLNQDKYNREKKIGILRINELILREGEFTSDNQIILCQNLRQGRAVKQSFYGKPIF